MLRDLTARQATHSRPTPRIGGLGIVLAFSLGCALYADRLGTDLLFALWAGVVVFLVGLREDIHRNVSPRVRLLAAFISAALAVAFTGGVVPDLGIFPGFLSQWVVPAIAVTLLWSAGACHAVNLIDGLNGLSSLYSITASIGFFVIAGHTGDLDIQISAALLIAAVLGFFILNWPLGRIFLGDAGAYGIGHILAWLGIILIARNPSVAGMAVLLLLFWPVCDTLFSIIRRRLTKKATGLPDRMHFHHLAVRALPLLVRRGRPGQFDNPTAAVLLLPFFSAPIFSGVVLWNRPLLAALALATYTALFMVSYVMSINYLASQRLRQKLRLISRPPNPARLKRQVSSFTGTYTHEDESFNVQIFRDHPKARWSLLALTAGAERVNLCGEFESDRDAYEYFLRNSHLAQAA